jgi:hypothetical protein
MELLIITVLFLVDYSQFNTNFWGEVFTFEAGSVSLPGVCELCGTK